MKVEIRRLCATDGSMLCDFFRALSKQTLKNWYHYPTPNSVYSETSYKLIAITNDSIIGLASLIPNDEYPDPSLSIVVANGYQKKGVGTKLMDALEIWGKELGYKAIFLTVFIDNEEGIDFYRKRGYRIEGIVSRKGLFSSYAMRKYLNRRKR